VNLAPAEFAQVKASLIPTYIVNQDDKLVLIELPSTLKDIVAGTTESITPGFAGRSSPSTSSSPSRRPPRASWRPSLPTSARPRDRWRDRVTTATVTPAGKTIAGSAVTAANVFTASGVINLVASRSPFVEGAGVFRITCLKS
jgi:hypothetical protein